MTVSSDLDRRFRDAAFALDLVDVGFDVVDSFYMNAAGIPGWFLSSRVLKRSVPPRGLLRLFNWMTPIFVWFEDKVRPPVGQSVVCIAERRGAIHGKRLQDPSERRRRKATVV